MKKIINILTILLCVCFITGCNKTSEEKNNTDALKVKEEYESLNGLENKNNGKKYAEISLDDDNPFTYVTASDIVKKVNNKETFMLYLGFPECPWCRNAITVLSSAAKATGIKNIYYFRLKDENGNDIRNVLKLDGNGNIITEKEGSKEYNTLIDLFSEKLDIYDGLNDSSIKRIYAPTVIFIQDGKVIGLHASTVSSQTNPYILLNDEQVKELKNIYEDYIHKMLDDLCDEKC